MKIYKVFGTVFVALLYWLLYWLWLPTLSIAYVDGFVFIAIGVIAAVALIAWWFAPDGELEYPGTIASLAFCIASVILIIGVVGSSSIFNSSSMYQQIGEFDKKDFTKDLVEIDNSQIPVVDIELATKLADKKMGEDAGMGSQMEVGEFTNKQQVNGKLVYVAPLEHRSFFKWNSNKAGTSGYVIVSATNTNDVKLVKELDGQPIKLKYLNSAYCSSDLRRHIRNSGFRNKGLTEYTFELNDEGRPYWVVTTYHNTTWWGNPEADGVVICDAQTGECKWYSIEETPEWVDIIQPEDFIKDQLKHYGNLVHGWWNPSEKDELSITPHITTVYNDGDCYYYTGMSSVGKDNGTVGFVMVNTRTKKVTYYKMVGATESAAMSSAQGKLQEKEYTATTPIPLNISGIPTYFLTLKDKEGLVKAYAMVNIEDYSIVATGNTIMETKRAYMNELTTTGNNAAFSSDEVYGYTVKGKVTRISANSESGNTFYYMILDDDRTKLYMASYSISEELPITREGDTVEISYIDESNGSINVVTFDNLDFSQEVSSDQAKKNEESQKNNIINNSDNQVIEVDPDKNEEEWDSLTDEEKAKILDNLEK